MLGEWVDCSEGKVFWGNAHVPHSFGGFVSRSCEDDVAFVGDNSFFLVEMSGATMVDKYSEGQEGGCSQFLEEMALASFDGDSWYVDSSGMRGLHVLAIRHFDLDRLVGGLDVFRFRTECEIVSAGSCIDDRLGIG